MRGSAIHEGGCSVRLFEDAFKARGASVGCNKGMLMEGQDLYLRPRVRNARRVSPIFVSGSGEDLRFHERRPK